MSENQDNSQDSPEQAKYSIEGYDNIQDFIKSGYKTLMEAIKHSNVIPQGSDWNFYSTHDGFVKIINDENSQVLKHINKILKTNQIEGNIRNRGIDEKTELIVEGTDNILERVANNIDEMNGIRKTSNAPILIQNVSAKLPVNGSWNRVNDATFSVTSSLNTQQTSKNNFRAITLMTAKNIIRPQKFFKDKIVNSSSLPWEPRIKEKPNSLKPLAIFLEQTEKGEEYSHPYEFELERFQPPSVFLQIENPTKPLPVEQTPLIEVNEPHQLDELLKTLLNCTEIAVDLEHHSYRTFMGITCLMQISTKEQDYLVDTLALRDKLHILNEVFTKPTILKVFHGADSDIVWLQRDLSIYVVNMFDTYFAAKQLEYSGLSLAYLMQRFCNFVPNKQFQLADWRIRPLPENLKKYAREDTHYLLYIYQKLKNELLAKANGKDNLLLSVFKNSNEICKKRFFKTVLRDDSYMDFYRKCKRLFDNRQLFALKELYRWRDQISREEDESTGYVLPNHMMLQIAETLPREMQGLLACCNPIPPLVRSNLLELHQFILRAKEQPLEKPILQEDTRARGTTKKMSKINVDSPLHCPHDLTRSSEFRDDLPTILGNKPESNVSILAVSKLENESTLAKCSVFHTPDNSDEEEHIVANQEKMQNFKFLGPFERYKLVRPYIQAEEEKLNREKTKEDTKEIEKPEDDNRTDEERIESIRNLFLSLSNKPPPTSNVENLNRSLIQMGGTKRKREIFPKEEQSVSQPLFLPISNDTIEENNPRKRRSSEAPEGAGPLKKNKKQKKKKGDGEVELSENRGHQQQYPGREHDQSNQQDDLQGQRNNNKNKQWKNNNAQHHQHNQQRSNHENQRGQHLQKQRGNNNQKQRGKQIKGQRGQHNNQKGQYNEKKIQHNDQTGRHGDEKLNDNERITPYDYSSVDFRQFQGGAGSVSKPKEFKSNFKFKGKNKGGNKGNNRSSLIGMPLRGGGKGRGGGRGKGGGRGRGQRGRSN